MSKLTTLTILLAVIGCVFADKSRDVYVDSDEEAEEFSALKLIPNDETETAYLKGEYTVFTDFCIKSRDEITNFLKSSAHSTAAGVFDALFSNFNELGDELITSGHDAVEQGAELIKQGAVATPKDETAESEEAAKENLEQSVENISLASVVTGAVKVVINAVLETAQTQVFHKLAILRAKFSSDNLREMITESCQSISYDLQKKLESKFSSTKNQIRTTCLKNPAMLEALTRAKIDTVGCLSIGRVSKISRFCDILKMAGPTIFPLLGM